MIDIRENLLEVIQIQENHPKTDKVRVMLDIEFSPDGLVEFYQKWGEVVSWDGEDEWYELGKFLVEKGWVTEL